MQEQQWLTFDDPRRVLFADAAAGVVLNLPIGDRKLRLFAIACCRSISHLLSNDGKRCLDYAIRAVDHPDGVETFKGRLSSVSSWGDITQGVAWMTDGANAVNDMLAELHRRMVPMFPLSGLLREIVGNPFRPVELPKKKVTCDFCGGLKQMIADTPWRRVTLQKMCQPCDGRGWFYSREDDNVPEDIRRLAESCYQGDCSAIGPLGDAIEEAGNFNYRILDHLRGSVWEYYDNAQAYYHTDTSGRQLTPHLAKSAHQHVKGCWAIDLLTGRK